jgi:hypothetical protein
MHARTPVEALVERLLGEPDLWPDLLALDDQDRFVAAVTGLAATWGLPLTADDVHAALVLRRREWFERWV